MGPKRTKKPDAPDDKDDKDDPSWDCNDRNLQQLWISTFTAQKVI